MLTATEALFEAAGNERGAVAPPQHTPRVLASDGGGVISRSAILHLPTQPLRALLQDQAGYADGHIYAFSLNLPKTRLQ